MASPSQKAEETIKSLVAHYTPNIYLEPERFKNILTDYYGADKKTVKLIKRVLDNDGGKLLYNQKDQEDKAFETTRRTLIVKIADIEFIPEEHIETGVNLLCIGLGKQVSTTFAPQAETPKKAPSSLLPTPPVKPSPPVKPNPPVNPNPPVKPNPPVNPKPPVKPTTPVKPNPPVKPTPPVNPKPTPPVNPTPNINPVFTGINHGLFPSSSARSIIIPEGVTTIGEKAFFGDKVLQSITLPSTLTVIEEHAFSGCSNLQSIIFPDSLTKIGFSAFARCSSLASLEIPASVKKIEGMAFASCTILKTVTFLGKKPKMGYLVFSGSPTKVKK